MPPAKSLLVGRSNECDIVLEDPTVGRRHLDIFCGSHGKFLLVDRGSTNGSYLRRGRLWERIRQTEATADEYLRLGDWEGTLRDLIERAPNASNFLNSGPERSSVLGSLRNFMRAAKPANSPERPVGRIQRNPETGEIESAKNGDKG